jgi:hypothetical protein
MLEMKYSLLIVFLVSCGVEEYPEPVDLPKPAENKEKIEYSYCGDNVCDEDEDYWNCYWDCSDFNGGPLNGYCGDGICYKETMTSCWKDCRPARKNMNPNPKPGPTPDPRP